MISYFSTDHHHLITTPTPHFNMTTSYTILLSITPPSPHPLAGQRFAHDFIIITDRLLSEEVLTNRLVMTSRCSLWGPEEDLTVGLRTQRTSYSDLEDLRRAAEPRTHGESGPQKRNSPWV